MAEANVRSHGPSDRHAATIARVRGALAMVAAALAGLRGWAGRRSALPARAPVHARRAIGRRRGVGVTLWGRAFGGRDERDAAPGYPSAAQRNTSVEAAPSALRPACNRPQRSTSRRVSASASASGVAVSRSLVGRMTTSV